MIPPDALIIPTILISIHRFKTFLGMVAWRINSGICICQGLLKQKDGSIKPEPNGRSKVSWCASSAQVCRKEFCRFHGRQIVCFAVPAFEVALLAFTTHPSRLDLLPSRP